MIISVIFFIVAILLVVKSAEWFLTSAEKIGLYHRLPPFILGVILVGFGTSLPELATSITAVMQGESGIVIPNIIGSNITNILLIVGVATIIMGTIKFEKDLIDLDLPLLIAMTFLFGLLVLDGSITRFDGALLLVSFIGYLTYSLFYDENQEYHKGLMKLVVALSKNRAAPHQPGGSVRPRIRTYILLVASIAVLGLSAKIAVDSLLNIVVDADIAVGVISFFALAIGTSLPELAVSLKALRRGQGDMVIGNIVGSSMFNMLLIGGLSGVLATQQLILPQGYWMLAGLLISVILLFASGITRRIHIWEGAAFILVYIAISFHIV